MKTIKDDKIDVDALLTSHDVGLLLQMNPGSVNKWVNDGRIVAFRTPGGHRRIRAGDLVDFLDRHHMPIPEPLAHASKRRILVVDDDAAQLRAIQRLLRPYGSRLEVRTIENGIDALVALGTFRPHLVVLDVFMPEVDGLEVLRRLKSNPETQHIQVIVNTGQYSQDVRKSAEEAGALRCLPKPVSTKVLLEAVGLSERAAV
ncbi:MAG: response regulator [Polyangiaceae bacterium]